MAIINGINSMIESYLNTNKKETGINNKPISQTNYSEDSYVPSTKFATDLGVYSKEADKCDSVEEVEKKVIFEEEYEEYCTIFLYPNSAGLLERVYYPPPNAPYEVKKAWIETMKSLTNNEMNTFKNSILAAVEATIGESIPSEMYQEYLNSNYASFKDITDLFTENFLDSKNENYDPFMEGVFNKLKTNYEKYSER